MRLLWRALSAIEAFFAVHPCTRRDGWTVHVCVFLFIAGAQNEVAVQLIVQHVRDQLQKVSTTLSGVWEGLRGHWWLLYTVPAVRYYNWASYWRQFEYTLTTVQHKLPTVQYKLPTVQCKLPTVQYKLPTVQYKLPTVQYIGTMVTVRVRQPPVWSDQSPYMIW